MQKKEKKIYSLRSTKIEIKCIKNTKTQSCKKVIVHMYYLKLIGKPDNLGQKSEEERSISETEVLKLF